jgi:hypothetical protein
MRKATTNNRTASTGASSVMTISSSNKPLILLEFSGHDTASIGYADNNTNNIPSAAQWGGPLHTVPLPPLVGVGLTSARDAEQMFGLYAAPLAELWSRLHDRKHHHHHHHTVVLRQVLDNIVARWWCCTVRDCTRIGTGSWQAVVCCTMCF